MPRFRIPNEKRPKRETIPVRPRPLFSYDAPDTVRPPVERGDSGGKVTYRPKAPRSSFVRAPNVRPSVPGRPRNYRVGGVITPPRPPAEPPVLTREDIGPVGPPASVNPRDVGPVGVAPELPKWLQDEAKVRGPDVRLPQMPYGVVKEGRYGVRVKQSKPEYVAPPVTQPREKVGIFDVRPAPSDDIILEGVVGDIMRMTRPNGDDQVDRDVDSRDVDHHDLLKGTSKYSAGVGMNHGRLVGEGM